MEEKDVVREPAAPVDPLADESERVRTAEAAAVRRGEAAWDTHDSPPAREGGLNADLVRACVVRFSIYCDSRWNAHTPPS